MEEEPDPTYIYQRGMPTKRKYPLRNKKIIETHRFDNRIGSIGLSAEGYRSFRAAQRMYGGEVASYVVDRIFQGLAFKKVPMVITIDANIYNRIEAKSKEHGYECAEDFMRDSITNSFNKAERSKP